MCFSLFLQMSEERLHIREVDDEYDNKKTESFGWRSGNKFICKKNKLNCYSLIVKNSYFKLCVPLGEIHALCEYDSLVNLLSPKMQGVN